jgi:hypothetical protein
LISRLISMHHDHSKSWDVLVMRNVSLNKNQKGYRARIAARAPPAASFPLFRLVLARRASARYADARCSSVRDLAKIQNIRKSENATDPECGSTDLELTLPGRCVGARGRTPATASLALSLFLRSNGHSTGRAGRCTGGPGRSGPGARRAGRPFRVVLSRRVERSPAASTGAEPRAWPRAGAPDRARDLFVRFAPWTTRFATPARREPRPPRRADVRLVHSYQGMERGHRRRMKAPIKFSEGGVLHNFTSTLGTAS